MARTAGQKRRLEEMLGFPLLDVEPEPVAKRERVTRKPCEGGCGRMVIGGGMCRKCRRRAAVQARRASRRGGKHAGC